MDNKYNFSQITKTMEKMFEAGFDTEKKILNIKLDDVRKMPSLTATEMIIIIDLKEAIKNKQIIAFLSGNKEEGR